MTTTIPATITSIIDQLGSAYLDGEDMTPYARGEVVS